MNTNNRVDPSHKLMKGTLVYFIGTFLSKALQFLLIPVITAILMPEEYGYYDVIVSTASLVIPVITLQVMEGMFRYLYNSSLDYARKLISNIVYLLIVSIILLGVGLLVLHSFSDRIQYPVLIFIYYFLFTINTFFQKITRSKGRNKVFAISGVVYTFTMLVLQYVSIALLNLRVEGLLISNILAYIISIIYINYKTGYYKYILLNKLDVKLIKEIVNYSMPLIPNSLSWWAIGSINTYIVIIFLGVDYNGILAIANKFPSLLTLATSVFQLSWQETAISESEDSKDSRFFSNVFNNYATVIFLFAVIVLFISKIINPYIVSVAYESSWYYIPPLIFAVVYSTLSSFLGAGYLASKKTKGAFTTTIFGSAVNIVITVAFIKYIGLYAPAIGKFSGFVVLMFIRIWDMKTYFKINTNWGNFLLLNAYSLVSVIMYYWLDGILLYLVSLISIVVFFIVNRVLIIKIATKMRDVIKVSSR